MAAANYVPTASKFIKQEAEMAWAAEHVVGVAKGAPEFVCDLSQVSYNGTELPQGNSQVS